MDASTSGGLPLATGSAQTVASVLEPLARAAGDVCVANATSPEFKKWLVSELLLWPGWGESCDVSKAPEARDPPGLVRRAFETGPFWLSGLLKGCISRVACGEAFVVKSLKGAAR